MRNEVRLMYPYFLVRYTWGQDREEVSCPREVLEIITKHPKDSLHRPWVATSDAGNGDMAEEVGVEPTRRFVSTSLVLKTRHPTGGVALPCFIA